MPLKDLRNRRKKRIRRKDMRSLPENRFALRKHFLCSLSEVSLSSFQWLKGSLTVEAACIMPVFLCCILSVFYVMHGIRTELCVYTGIWETAEEMALHAALLEEGKNATDQVLGAGALSVYGRTKVLERLGEDGVGVSVMKGGAGGLSFLGSSLVDQNMIQIQTSYHLQFPLGSSDFIKIPVSVKANVRAWTGRTSSAKGEALPDQERKVYVTTTGTVYHLDAQCSHIRLSVKRVALQEVQNLRNQDGGRYHPCEVCNGKYGDMVYITDTGDRYHSTISCRGLKRGVMEIPLSELKGWKACNRCGG